MPSTAVLLHLKGDRVGAELLLPIIELRLGWQKPVPMDANLAAREYGEALKGYVRQHVRPTTPDGRPWTVRVDRVTPVPEEIPDLRVELTMTPPPRAPADRFTLDYDVVLHQLITHTAIVSVASDPSNGKLDGPPELLGTLTDRAHRLAVDRSGGGPLRSFAATFRLGARHIAEGTDHLLFLLALLLPAPLLAAGGRWGGYAGRRASLRRIVKVVTAFTLGHSLTLVLGALGLVRLPSALVESAIALSILVSALHALVPVFRGREALIAGGFGLVHGLAFASTLVGFGFDPVTMVVSVLGFNLGIEAFQLLLIVLTMPPLVILARTPRLYAPLRIGGAVLTGVAAGAWFLERAFGMGNPIGPLVEAGAARGPWLLGGLFALALGAVLLRRFRADEARRV